jgi:hypothetical protein
MATDTHEYLVVLRARSSVRFKEAEGVALNVALPPVVARGEARIRTRWEDGGFDSALPRELWVQIRLAADSIDSACASGTRIAHQLAVLAAFCANVTCDLPEVHIAYSVTPRDGRREFVEVFQPDQTGLVREGRMVDTQEYLELTEAVGKSPYADRVNRALNQYAIALRYWYIGGEMLCLAHLYMAVEALTKDVIRYECARLGMTAEELARANDIDPGGDDGGRWNHLLEVWARREAIFDGDAETYRAARHASDGFEHGFLEYSKINQHALAVTSVTFGYVRRAMLRLLGIPEDSPLAVRAPMDVGSWRKLVRGYFVGDVEDPALPGEEYPLLEWNSRVISLRLVEDRFVVRTEEKMTPKCAEGVVFQGKAFEVRGRVQSDGFKLSEEELTATVAEKTLLERTWAMADRVRALTDMGEVNVSRDSVTAVVFEALAQQIALFEAITHLVRDRRPVEAMYLLNHMAECACRIELMCDAPAGLKWMLRARLDYFTYQLDFLRDDTDPRIREQVADLHTIARRNHITIPGDPWPLAQCRYWADQAEYMNFIRAVCRSDSFAVQLHARQSSLGFQLYTQIDNEALAVGVLCDAMTALLVSISTSSPVLNRAVADTQELIDEIAALAAKFEDD